MAFVTPFSILIRPTGSSASCQLRPSTLLGRQILRCSPRLAARTVTLVHPRHAPRMDVGEGDSAPSFAGLPTSGGGKISVSDLGALYVIYFYPKDSTSGCTCEATDFTTYLGDIEAAGAKVLGVSRDSVESHDTFVKEVGIGFPLLADVTGEVSDAYGVYKLRQMFGKEFMGIERSTFIVKDGVIAKAWRGVKAQGHAEEVVGALKQV